MYLATNDRKPRISVAYQDRSALLSHVISSPGPIPLLSCYIVVLHGLLLLSCCLVIGNRWLSHHGPRWLPELQLAFPHSSQHEGKMVELHTALLLTSHWPELENAVLVLSPAKNQGFCSKKEEEMNSGTVGCNPIMPHIVLLRAWKMLNCCMSLGYLPI